jgi:hypothetical protein
LFEACNQIAAPNGQVFTSAKHPEGMTTKALQELVRRIIARTGITGNKLGAHTIRHSSASMVIKETGGNREAVKSIIQDTSNRSAETYIHDYEDGLKDSISPLDILAKHTKQNTENNQLLLESSNENSTALVPVNQSDEPIEGEIDLSEELFPRIPQDIKTIRPRITKIDLDSMREAFVYFSRHAPLNSITGHLSQMLKTMTRSYK